MQDTSRTLTIEETVWSGGPSQLVNLPIYVVCALLFWLVVPVFYAVWRWLVLRTTRYELTSERLKLRRGVFNRHLDEIELYRVRDYRFEQPFFLRLFSLGNILLTTTDKSQPLVTLRAVPDGEALFNRLRGLVEECRRRKGVREFDLE